MPGLYHVRDFPNTSFHLQLLHIHRSLVIILTYSNGQPASQFCILLPEYTQTISNYQDPSIIHNIHQEITTHLLHVTGMFVSSAGSMRRTGSIRRQTVTSRVARTEFFVRPQWGSKLTGCHLPLQHCSKIPNDAQYLLLKTYYSSDVSSGD